MRNSSFGKWRKGIVSLTIVALAASLLSALTVGAAGEKIKVHYVPIQYYFDDVKHVAPANQKGFIYNNFVYVPLRYVGYSLHQSVKWDSATTTVTVGNPIASDIQTIRQYNVSTLPTDANSGAPAKSGAQTIEVVKKKVNYIFNGEVKVPDDNQPGLLINNSLYVPIGFFSKSLGKTIGWDNPTKTVSSSSTPEELKYVQTVYAADEKIMAIQNKCTQKVTKEVVPQFLAAATRAAQLEILANGEAYLEGPECKGALLVELDQLKASLTENNLKTEIVDQYAVYFDKEIESKRKFAESYLKDE